MSRDIIIRTVVEPEIEPSLDQSIRQLQQRSFPQEELFRISRHYVHQPRQGDLRVLGFLDTQLVAQVVAYQAVAEYDGGAITLACFGNVCSDPDFRGTGAAGRCLNAAMEHARWADRQWAMLFCAENLCDFYARFGFGTIKKNLWVTAPNSHPRVYPKDDTCMVTPLAGQNIADWPTQKLVLDIDIF